MTNIKNFPIMIKKLIDEMIHESLGERYNQKFKFDIRIFETEYEMLNVFLECINKYFIV